MQELNEEGDPDHKQEPTNLSYRLYGCTTMLSLFNDNWVDESVHRERLRLRCPPGVGVDVT